MASVFILIENGIGRIGGNLYIIAYILYIRHTIDTYRELGVEKIGKNGIIKNIYEIYIGLTGILIGEWILVNTMIGL